MFRLLRYLKNKERLFALFTLALICAQIIAELKIPEYMAAVTRLVQTPGVEISEIWTRGLYMLLFTLLSVFLAIAASFFTSQVAAGMAKTLREAVFVKVTSFSMEEIQRFSTGSLLTRSTNDIMQVQQFFMMGLLMLLRAPFMAVFALMKIVGKGQQWYRFTGISVGLVLALITIVFLILLPSVKRMQKLADRMNRVTREHLTGLRVIRAYNAERYQEEKFALANDELTRNFMTIGRGVGLLFPLIPFIISLLSLGIYWIGAQLINEAEPLMKLPVFSDMVVFSSYITMVMMAFVMLSMLFVLLPRAQVSARRLNEVLSTQSSMEAGKRQEGEAGSRGEIEFRNVSFAYPGMKGQILENLNFRARKGETLAIIGATGCGKTSLVQLIPRFYDASAGEVLVDGVNVREYEQNALFEKIAFVPQKSVIFSGTIASNVAYGAKARERGGIDEERVQYALDIAQASSFVEKMEGGLNAHVARSGDNLSGGQKQRLSIARAIYRQPEIFIFDDSFSALDYKTDRDLRGALKESVRGATLVIVAQRIGTIMDADRILVLDEGKIVGEGRHEELLTNCPVYREIALTQFSEEELGL